MNHDPVDVTLPSAVPDTASSGAADPSPFPPAAADVAAGAEHESTATALRAQIGSDLARTVLATTARRLVDAIEEFDTALDRRASLLELQNLDREVACARRDHAAARRPDGEAPSSTR